MRWCTLVFILLRGNLVAAASAQVVELGHAAVGPGDTVRVRTTPYETIEGPVVRLTNDFVTIQLGHSLRTVSADSIDSLWIRRNSVRRGAIVGGLLAALPLYVWSASDCRISLDCGDDSGIYGLIIIAGAAVGTIMGAQIGSLIPRWQLVSARTTQFPSSMAVVPRRSWVGFTVRF
jgi:hypothetical protein